MEVTLHIALSLFSNNRLVDFLIISLAEREEERQSRGEREMKLVK